LEAIRTKLQHNATAVILEPREQKLAQSFHPIKQFNEPTNNQSTFGTMGRHVIAELSNCNQSLISSVEHIQKTLEDAVRKAGATIISSRFHQFSPIGVSGIILLSESHCSIHTWPEEGYAAIDIYTCGDHVFPQVACDHIAQELQSANVFVTSLERGLRTGSHTFGHISTGSQA